MELRDPDPDAASLASPRAASYVGVLVGFLLVSFLVAFLRMEFAFQKYSLALGFLVVLGIYAVHAARTPWTGARILGVPMPVASNIGLLLVLAALNFLYAAANRPFGTVHSMKTGIDEHTPVVPIFVIPYLGFYIVYVSTLAWFALHRLDRQLRTAVVAFALAESVGLMTFVIFQTWVTPPTIAGSGPFWYVLRYINDEVYSGKFYSCFPSLHCAFATVLGIMWVRRSRGRHPLGAVVAVLFSLAVVAATQFLHMHYLMDAIYGVVLAFATYGISWFVLESPHRRPVAATPG